MFKQLKTTYRFSFSKRTYLLCKKSFALGFLVLTSLSANADIINMCQPQQSCAANAGVVTGVDTQIGLNWAGVIDNVSQSTFPTELVSSTGGYFYVLGGPNQTTILGTLTSPISQAITYSASAAPFNIVETITVPGSISAAAANLGSTTVFLHRDFLSPFSNVGADLQINLLPAPPSTPTITNPPPPTGNNPLGLLSSNLELQNVALRFDDDSISKIVQRNQPIQAEAELTYANGGMLVGQWEIATPASTQGEPVFLPLENIRIYLNPSRNKLLTSPTLPSDQAGLYLLRFQIQQPQLQNVSAIQIQYFVREKVAAFEKEIRPMRVVAPNANAWLAPTTEFSWQGIPGAGAYRVEIFASESPPATWAERVATARRSQSMEVLQDDGQAITGVLVPGSQTKAVISAVSFSYLNRRNEYLWRVIAIDSNGFVIGETAPRSIFTQ